MKVALVLHEFARGWVIEKLAIKLCEALATRGVEAFVSHAAVADADVNHFMIFHYADPQPGTLNTTSVTHVDDALKIDMIKRQLAQGVRAAICMSSMTVDQLADHGVDRGSLTYAVPAHDGGVAPRRLIIGVTSNCYSDGRKREWLLVKLAGELRLDLFAFHFYGSGWEGVAPALEQAGAEVRLITPSDDDVADYACIRAAVPTFDYYFYPGLDEGSLGTLDALAAGVKTIVTLQGYHLDLPHGVSHGFWDYPELKAIFETISADREARISVARRLSWDHYAERHLAIWNALREDNSLPAGESLGEGPRLSAPGRYELIGYRQILANPYRRQMALQFWIPGAYATYRKARGSLGRLARRFRPA